MKIVRKQFPKQHYFSKVWLKIGIITAILGLIATAVITHHFFSNPNAPRFIISVSEPTPAAFTNNAIADFIGPSALPEVNNNREIGTPGELVISYDQVAGDYTPAIRMDASDSDINKSIKITPAIAGTWNHRGSNTVVFQPNGDWPADTKFSVKIDKSILNSDANIRDRKVTFTTPALNANVDSFATYPATEPKSVIGVAIISFNYPVNVKTISDRTTMRLDGKKIDFDIKYDRFHRTAIITSTPIKITEKAQTLRIKMNRIPGQNDDAMSQKITANTTIESADNIFKISGLETTIADDPDGLPQQLLLINTTSAAAPDTKWTQNVELFLLPKYRDTDSEHDYPHKWATDEITENILKKSEKLVLKQIEFENPNGVYQYALSYDVSDDGQRFIYAVIHPGVMSAAGFKMKNGINRVMSVPYPEKSVKIMGTGALLAMGGEKKLGITARGGADAAYVNLYKVKTTEINHLISQTYNVFGSMEFKSWSFDAYDMAVVFKKRIGFSDTSVKHVNYASVDLGDYLDRTHNDKTGIFIIQTGPSQSQADYSDRRLILLTNLGIVRKINLDQSSTIFISTLATGEPASDTEIYVLGRNGNSVWAGRTDDNGRADIPNLPWNEYKNEKAPVAIVARKGNDVSFIPYDNAYDRRVEYSKFDIDGTYASATTPLNAFLFTDRGIYRPGENAIIGGIIKNKTFKSLPGIPVKLEIRNPRGKLIFEKIFSLTPDGMFDIKYNIPSGAQVGEYNFQIFSLNAKNKPQDILGYASFRVEEFTPDNLKISAKLTGIEDNGWMTPTGQIASVSLHNMFGTPASDRQIKAKLILTPAPFDFKEFPGYKFTDNFISGSGVAANMATKTIIREFNEIKTDDNGNANIDLNISEDLADNTTYALTLMVQGFEANAGRSVQTSLRGRVSNAKYLIGWHTNSDLSYINSNANRTIKFIAIDHTGKQTTASNVTMRLVKRENLTSLVKDGSGYYKYQTVTRDKVITENNVTITDKGMEINLDTSTPGTYFLQVLNASDNILANIEYFVAGDKNTDMHSDTQAELQIKLNATEYTPGDTIAVSVTAPYTGYGLITIERDKVYAFKWFRTNTTNSVQNIKVPTDFEGTGYVNVSFVRDINSRDIFTTPYTYAVAPFTADTARRTIKIKLAAPDVLSDSKLNIQYETNHDAKLMIFAVNDGILQVARYQIPNPIAHFFKKAALQVETYQILSLILPEYKILHEFAKTGGGDYNDMDGGIGGLINPFARKNDKAVAFYSEIINAKSGMGGTVTFDVPDSFNGSLRVFAVASGESGIGAADTTVLVRHPVIVTTNTPLNVAPGDKFEINTVTTNLTGNDENTKFSITATASKSITIEKPIHTELTIPADTEQLWTINAQAENILGPADITITAKTADLMATSVSHMSVRPITPYTTDIRMGMLDQKETTIRVKYAEMYPDQSEHKLYVSYGADAIVKPLVEYLKHYDWNCTEQLTSRAMPYAAIGASDLLAITYDNAADQIEKTILALKNRQNDDGSFALWAGGNTQRNNESNADTAYLTAYVVLFLNTAQNKGFDVPRDMISRAVDYLRTYAGTNINDLRDGAAHAFAIYIITANEYVTTAYISQFEEWANTNWKNWESSLSGQYIAAAYAIMHQDDRADTISKKYKPDDVLKYTSAFDNTISNNALAQYIRVKYLGANKTMPDKQQIKYINNGQYSSFTAATIILSHSGNIGNTNSVSDALQVMIDGNIIDSNTASGNFAANIPANAKKINIKCSECGTSANFFWAIIHQGYPKSVTSQSQGLDVVREYYDSEGNKITHANIGDQVTVKIFARARGDVQNVPNAVIIDLLPGGFIADTNSINGNYTHAEVREDRIIIYADINRTEAVYSYTAQIGSAGTFAIPPIHAEDMYNPDITFTGRDGTFTVTNETNK